MQRFVHAYIDNNKLEIDRDRVVQTDRHTDRWIKIKKAEVREQRSEQAV